MNQTALMVEPLARLYANAEPVIPTSAELAALVEWIDRQWMLVPAEVEILFTYAERTLAQTISEYIETGHLVISIAHNDHPYLTADQNARFRAIHDWHHIEIGADDSLKGEIATYYRARSTAPQAIWWMLRSEIVLQAAACIHYGAFLQQKFVRT